MSAVLRIADLKRAVEIAKQYPEDVADFYYVAGPTEINDWDHLCRLKSTYRGLRIVAQVRVTVLDLMPWPFLPSDSKPTR